MNNETEIKVAECIEDVAEECEVVEIASKYNPAVVGAVAGGTLAVAAGIYLVVKNKDRIRNFFATKFRKKNKNVEIVEETTPINSESIEDFYLYAEEAKSENVEKLCKIFDQED
jgi:hypothetical protein